MPKKQVCITLDNTMIENLRLLAEENNRSLSGYINHVLKLHLQMEATTLLLNAIKDKNRN